MATVTDNGDGTLTVGLRAGERTTLAWATQKFGPLTLEAALDAWFQQHRQMRKAETRDTIVAQYEALSPAQQADVDAILALAVIE